MYGSIRQGLMGTPMDGSYGSKYGAGPMTGGPGIQDPNAMVSAPMGQAPYGAAPYGGAPAQAQGQGQVGPTPGASPSFDPNNPLDSIRNTNKYVMSGGYDRAGPGRMMPSTHNTGAGIF